jgi:EAL domain-containing protein (putative c-di-GMP-specific phosphodiesterase class I)
LGVRIALDDFGTGYSSLSYLKCFPIDVVKIDRSFVADITSDPEAAALAAAIITMARSLKREVVAEGVETVEQLKLLSTWGCDAAQGYYFSHPLHRIEFTKRFVSTLPPDDRNKMTSG